MKQEANIYVAETQEKTVHVYLSKKNVNTRLWA